MNERSIFAAALDIADPADRAAYLDRACAGDAGLRRHVEELLAAQSGLGSFLNRPAAVPDRTAAYEPLAEGPGSRVGPYKLLQEIGEGGMGTVFMAEQEEPVRRMVAVKIIRAGMDSKGVLARFEAERQALALMDHPNIARVLDAGTTAGGSPYFVMELVKGVPITKFCDENQLSLRERLELFIPVCQAIQHAHMKGIIHRDVKPSNVLVAMYDDKPVPKVIDFGVAKATSQKLTDKTLFTAFGAVVGTLEYMSPEQAKLNQLDIDTRSDVYALGVLLYELLTGSTPLDRARLKSAALDEVLRLIREEEPPKPSTRLSTAATLPQIAAARGSAAAQLGKVVRGELDWIVMKSLEKDRTRRYETAISLARDVERYLKDEAVEACPPTLGYRLKKAYRKHRTAVRVASAFACLMVGAMVMGAVLAVRATDAERDARAEAARADDERGKAVTREHEANDARRDADNRAAELKAEQERTEGLLYVSRMNQAQLAAVEFQMPRLLELLADTTPKPGKRDLRGWEWHYLNRQHHGWESATPFEGVSGLTVTARDVISTRDGSRVVVPPYRSAGFGLSSGNQASGGARPGMSRQSNFPARAFDTATGKVVLSRAVPESASGFRLSPCGEFLAYLDRADSSWFLRLLPPERVPTHRVRLMELSTGKDIPVPLPPVPSGAQVWPSEGARRLTVVTNPTVVPMFNPARPPIPSNDTAATLIVWEREQDRVGSREILTGPERPGASVEQVSPDGTTVILVHSPDPQSKAPNPVPGRVLEFWDVSADPPKLLKAHRHAVNVRPLRVSASGTILAVAVCNPLKLEDKPLVCLYDTRTGEPRGRWELPSGIITNRVSIAMAVSDDARRVVVSEPPGVLIVGERADGGPVHEDGRWRVHLRRIPETRESLGLSRQDFSHLWLSPDGARLTSIATPGNPRQSEWVRYTWDLARNPEYAATWPDQLTVDGELCPSRRDPYSRHVTYPLAYASRFQTGSVGPAVGGAKNPENPVGNWPVEVYNPRLGRVVHRFAGSDRLIGASLSPDGTRVLLLGSNFGIPNAPLNGPNSPHVYRLRTVGRPGGDEDLLRIEKKLPTQGPFVATPLPYLTDDGQWVIEPVTSLASSGVPARIASEYKVWKAADGKLSCTIPAGSRGRSLTHVPGPNGGRFVTAPDRITLGAQLGEDAERSIICYDPASGKKLWDWEPPVITTSEGDQPAFGSLFMAVEIHLSPDGRQLAVSTIRIGPGDAVTVRLLDTSSGSVCRELHAERESLGLRSVGGNRYSCGAFGPNGSFALGLSGGVIVWDGRNAEPVHRLTGHTATCAVFSDDGRRLFTYDDGVGRSEVRGQSVRVWDMATGRETLAIRRPTANRPLRIVGGRTFSEMWLEGERLMLWWGDGIRVFDGTPVLEPKK